jgi:hypothetical protein
VRFRKPPPALVTDHKRSHRVRGVNLPEIVPEIIDPEFQSRPPAGRAEYRRVEVVILPYYFDSFRAYVPLGDTMHD